MLSSLFPLSILLVNSPLSTVATLTSQATVDVLSPSSRLLEEESIEHQETVSVPENNTARSVDEISCGLWLAPSTLRGAGIGMFAGRVFKADEILQQSGEVVVPIVDLYYHQHESTMSFHWDECTYTICDMRRESCYFKLMVNS